MYDDYPKLLLHIYNEKKKGNILSGRLMNPTPANLKEECVIALRRLKRRDEKALKDFFKQDGENVSWERVIKNFETDKFRPIQSYLLNDTNSMNEIRMEVLAWLLDLRDRPYNPDIDYSKLFKRKPDEITGDDFQDSMPVIGDPVINGNEFGGEVATRSSQGSDPDINFPNQEKSAPGKRKYITVFRKKIAAFIIPVAILAAAYFTFNNKQSSGGCMYWTGDHYEVISCHPRTGDTVVIALDSLKLINFKRIKEPATITYNSIGSVWYSKINNKYEYFTAGGYHPKERGKKLRPISKHIIDSQIIPLQTGKVFN